MDNTEAHQSEDVALSNDTAKPSEEENAHADAEAEEPVTEEKKGRGNVK